MKEINILKLRKIFLNKEFNLKTEFVNCVYTISKIKHNKQFPTSVIIDIKIKEFNYISKGDYPINKEQMSRKSKTAARRYILPFITNEFKTLTEMVNENCWINLEKIQWT